MPQVNVSELKNRTSEIIRSVHEEQIEYIIIYHGKPTATLQPIVDEQQLAGVRSNAEYWARLDALAREINANWTSDKTAIELIDEQRRDLSTMDSELTGRD